MESPPLVNVDIRANWLWVSAVGSARIGVRLLPSISGGMGMPARLRNVGAKSIFPVRLAERSC